MTTKNEVPDTSLQEVVAHAGTDEVVVPAGTDEVVAPVFTNWSGFGQNITFMGVPILRSQVPALGKNRWGVRLNIGQSPSLESDNAFSEQ